MNMLLHVALIYLLNALWQAPLLTGAAWLLASFARRAGALTLEHRIWVGALIAAAVLPVASGPLHHELTTLRVWLEPVSSQASTTGYSAEAILPILNDGAVLAVLRVAAMTFLAVVLCLLCRFLFQLVSTLRLRATALPFCMGGADAMSFAELQRRLGLRRIGIALHLDLQAPATLGLRHPLILLPDSFLSADAEAQRVALAHELVHVARHDFAWNLLFRFLTPPVAWHPCVSFAQRKVVLTREQLCDRRAAELTGDTRLYARSLLRLAELLLQPAPALRTHTVGIFDSTQFERRITMLQQKRKPLTRTAGLMLAATVCTVTVGAGTLAVAFGGTPAFAAVLRTTGDKPQQVPSNIMAGQALNKVTPKYPEAAKKAKIQGTVVLAAVIGRDGSVQNLNVISGAEELRASALDAVRQWTYKPYLLNGEPTDVETTITVTYSLAP